MCCLPLMEAGSFAYINVYLYIQSENRKDICRRVPNVDPIIRIHTLPNVECRPNNSYTSRVWPVNLTTVQGMFWSIIYKYMYSCGFFCCLFCWGHVTYK